MKSFATFCLATLLLSAPELHADDHPPAPAPGDDALHCDSALIEVFVPPVERKASFTFAVTNLTSSNLVVLDLLSTCGCAIGKLPSKPWLLLLGDGGHITSTLDVLGQTGSVSKTLTVVHSAGTRLLTMKATMPLPDDHPDSVTRLRNFEIARTNRQAVFSGDCASCHLEPARGKSGRELYAAACGICHDAIHRAPVVTDLRKSNPENDPEFWRNFIRQGKAGSMMPAFGEADGGPLTTAQIESLVAYLANDYRQEAPIKPPLVSLTTPPGTTSRWQGGASAKPCSGSSVRPARARTGWRGCVPRPMRRR